MLDPLGLLVRDVAVVTPGYPQERQLRIRVREQVANTERSQLEIIVGLLMVDAMTGRELAVKAVAEELLPFVDRQALRLGPPINPFQQP